MKKCELALALMMLMPVSLVFAGGNSGGGGGGICIEKKCVTITEAGFRVSEESDDHSVGYELPGNVLEELDLIVSALPSKWVVLKTEEIIGKRGDIIMLESADDKKTRKFLNEYRRLLKKQGFAQAEDVEILAFTSKGITYLIREKFEALGLRGQALLLIHEYNLRTREGVSLQDALVFDGSLADYLNATENNQSPNIGDLVKGLVAIKLLAADRAESFQKKYALFRRVEMANGIKIRAHSTREEGKLAFSFEDILRLRKEAPDFAKGLKEGEFEIGASYIRGRVIQDFYEEFLGRVNHENVALNGKSFESYLKSRPQISKQGFEEWEGPADRSVILRTIPGSYDVSATFCDSDFLVIDVTQKSSGWISVGPGNKYANDIQGLSLEIPSQLCVRPQFDNGIGWISGSVQCK